MTPEDALLALLGSADLEGSTLNVLLAAYLEDDPLPQYRTLSVTPEVASAFADILKEFLERKAKLHKSADVVLGEYTAEYKPDPHEITFLEIEGSELEELLHAVPSASVNVPVLDLTEAFVEHLRFYALVLEWSDDRIVLFRSYNPNKELTRSKNLLVRLMGDVYGVLQEPTFQFDKNFDAALYDGYLFIFNQHFTQQMFRYYEELREVAKAALAIVEEHVPIANLEEFKKSALGQVQKLAKLRNISRKPYLAALTTEDIKRAIVQFKLDVEIVTENGEEKLVFDPAKPWAILKLLDDDYLFSVMTGQDYEVNSKRALPPP